MHRVLSPWLFLRDILSIAKVMGIVVRQIWDAVPGRLWSPKKMGFQHTDGF